MATGTGKTVTSLKCMEHCISDNKDLLVVISCPFNHLIDQWSYNVDPKKINHDNLIADSRNPNWKNIMVDKLLDLDMGIIDNLIIYTTHNTFSNNDFIDIIKKYKEELKDKKILVIVDEVHGIGSLMRKKGLIQEYDFRLGLSATPKRWFDIEGTDKIYKYFDKSVYSYELKNAIKDGYLTPYYYKPYFITLTEDEIKNYIEKTKKISKLYYVKKDDEEKEKLFSLFCIIRQQIVRNAIQKYDVLKIILSRLEKILYCLVYCSPIQINTVQGILNEHNIIQHKFTQKEGIKKEEKYGGISEREFLLNQFSEGVYQALVSMRCLDEGVDIPPARIAIMMDNSGNPREFIQRRGRILRTYPNKENATIYDIIVKPSLSNNAYIDEMERKIFERELNRYEEFSQIALNADECNELISDLNLNLQIERE